MDNIVKNAMIDKQIQLDILNMLLEMEAENWNKYMADSDDHDSYVRQQILAKAVLNTSNIINGGGLNYSDKSSDVGTRDNE